MFPQQSNYIYGQNEPYYSRSQTMIPPPFNASLPQGSFVPNFQPSYYVPQQPNVQSFYALPQQSLPQQSQLFYTAPSPFAQSLPLPGYQTIQEQQQMDYFPQYLPHQTRQRRKEFNGNLIYLTNYF